MERSRRPSRSVCIPGPAEAFRCRTERERRLALNPPPAPSRDPFPGLRPPPRLGLRKPRESPYNWGALLPPRIRFRFLVAVLSHGPTANVSPVRTRPSARRICIPLPPSGALAAPRPGRPTETARLQPVRNFFAYTTADPLRPPEPPIRLARRIQPARLSG